MSLFRRIWIKGHFPFAGPKNNFIKIVILIFWCIDRVSIEGGLVVSLIAMLEIFFSCSYDSRSCFKDILPLFFFFFFFLLIALFYILLGKFFLIWVTFCTKHRLSMSCHAISSLFYVFILIHFNLLSSVVQFFYFAKWGHYNQSRSHF